jgi:hypothetical protein
VDHALARIIDKYQEHVRETQYHGHQGDHEADPAPLKVFQVDHDQLQRQRRRFQHERSNGSPKERVQGQRRRENIAKVWVGDRPETYLALHDDRWYLNEHPEEVDSGYNPEDGMGLQVNHLVTAL